MLASLGAIKALVKMLAWAPNMECRTWAAASLALLVCDESGSVPAPCKNYSQTLITPGAVALQNISSATRLLAIFATPSNGGVLPLPTFEVLARKDSIYADPVEDASWIKSSDEDSLASIPDELSIKGPNLTSTLMSMPGPTKTEMLNKEPSKPIHRLDTSHSDTIAYWSYSKAEAVRRVDHRSLVTACILSLWRAYGHDDGRYINCNI